MCDACAHSALEQKFENVSDLMCQPVLFYYGKIVKKGGKKRTKYK